MSTTRGIGRAVRLGIRIAAAGAFVGACAAPPAPEPTTVPVPATPARPVASGAAVAAGELIFAASTCVTRQNPLADFREAEDVDFWPPAIWIWSDARAVSIDMRRGVIVAVEGRIAYERAGALIDRFMSSFSERGGAPDGVQEGVPDGRSYVGAFAQRGERRIARVAEGVSAWHSLADLVGALHEHIRDPRRYVPPASRFIEIVDLGELGADEPPVGFAADRLEALAASESVEIGSAHLEWLWEQVIVHRLEGPQMLFGETAVQQGLRRYGVRLKVPELEAVACRR